MAKVYAVVSYNLLEYVHSMHVCGVYSTREAAERNKPDDNEYNEYEIREWEVIDV